MQPNIGINVKKDGWNVALSKAKKQNIKIRKPAISKKGILKLAIFFLKLFFKYIQIKPAKNSKHLELIE